MGRILVAGFSGRGNAGDEALMQCIHEALRPRHEVCFAMHPTDCHPEYRQWYPYDGCELLDETSIGGIMGRCPDGLVIGGGGLSPAHAASLALTMRFLGKPTVLVGTDNLDLMKEGPGPATFRDYMANFRYVGMRFEKGVLATRAIGVEADYGADWAFRLPSAPTPPPVEGRPAAVTIRAWDPHLHDHAFRYRLHALFHGLRTEGYEPFLLPFSPEDAALAQRLSPVVEAEVAEAWWNPRAVKGMMAGCALVVSVGRLHPLIFAAPLGVPVTHVGPPVAPEGLRVVTKAVELCREVGIAEHADVESFLAALWAGTVGPADQERVADAIERCERMREAMLSALDEPDYVEAPLLRRPTASRPASGAGAGEVVRASGTSHDSLVP